jgi:hypothetical protein
MLSKRKESFRKTSVDCKKIYKKVKENIAVHGGQEYMDYEQVIAMRFYNDNKHIEIDLLVSRMTIYIQEAVVTFLLRRNPDSSDLFDLPILSKF